MYYQIVGTNVRIAGTMHLVPADSAVLPSWVSPAFDWSEVLVLEHAIDSADWQWLKTLPGGETVEQKVAPALWQQLKAVWPLQQSGILGSLRLWAVLASIARISVGSVAPGVEPTYVTRARDVGRRFAVLETPSQFAEAANRIDDARYVRMIEVTLNQLPQAAGIFREIYNAWSTDRINVLTEIIPRTALGADPVIRAAVIDDRNIAWMPKILSATSQNLRTLFAVGALHLAGPKGLRALLKEQGFETSPVVDV
jgi:uncharacterized protein YbaP (TraB family)